MNTNNPSQIPNNLTNKRAKEIALIFSQYAEKYTGDITLPRNITGKIQKDLKSLGVKLYELDQLDQRPYAYLPHDLASRAHWLMRRFRNSEGWRAF